MLAQRQAGPMLALRPKVPTLAQRRGVPMLALRRALPTPMQVAGWRLEKGTVTKVPEEDASKERAADALKSSRADAPMDV